MPKRQCAWKAGRVGEERSRGARGCRDHRTASCLPFKERWFYLYKFIWGLQDLLGYSLRLPKSQGWQRIPWKLQCYFSRVPPCPVSAGSWLLLITGKFSHPQHNRFGANSKQDNFFQQKNQGCLQCWFASLCPRARLLPRGLQACCGCRRCSWIQLRGVEDPCSCGPQPALSHPSGFCRWIFRDAHCRVRIFILETSSWISVMLKYVPMISQLIPLLLLFLCQPPHLKMLKCQGWGI